LLITGDAGESLKIITWQTRESHPEFYRGILAALKED
jgi:hypothetical protein